MAILDAPIPRPREEGEGARRNNLLDVLAWTMLGEAANQGDTGMSAIAHVVLNRANSGRYPSDPLKVALQPKQFSAWNATNNGGNKPKERWGRDSAEFQHARELAQGVLDGKIPDPTGGATHYWAPKPMKAVTGKEDPYWAPSEERRAGQGRLTLGDHVFLPRNRQPPSPASMSPGARDRAGAVQTVATAADAAWPSGPPLPRRRPDDNPRPPAFIPGPPVPHDMPPRIQQARTGNFPPLPSPAPLVNPMAYGQPNQSAQLTPATVPMYRENWSDSLDMSKARPSLSAMTAAQNVARGASDAYQSVAGRPQTVPVNVEFVSDTQPPDPRMDVERLQAKPGRNGWAAQYGIDTASQQAWKTGEAAPQPKEMSPALRAARERLQAARDARNGITSAADTAWNSPRRVEPKSGATETDRTDFGFQPVPQGGRPNIDIPGQIRWGTPDPSIDAMMAANAVQGAAGKVQAPPPKPLVAPQPMPRPADRMPVQAQPQTLPQGQNWMDAAAAGIPRMVEQVNAAMPKGNTEPSWYELQTGNPGSRGPTAVQILGMINTNRLMNSLGSYQGGPPTISTTYRRRNVEPAGWPSPTDYAEYARVANSLASMQHHRLGGPSLGTFTVDGRTMDLRPGIQDFNNYEGRSISTPDGSPLWSYN